MAEPTAKTLHSITITRLTENASRMDVAQALMAAARNAPLERILKRLESLPWTLTTSASAHTVTKLVPLLEKRGATVEVSPPLPQELIPEPVQPSWTAPAHVSPPLPVPDSSPAEPAAPWIELEPLTLGGILDRSFTLCRDYFWKLFTIAAIPFVVALGILLLAFLVFAVAGFTSWETLGEKSIPLLIIMGIALLVPVIIVLVLVFYLSQGALIYAVSIVHLGREVAVRQSYEFVFQRLGRFIATSILFGLALSATFLVAVVLAAVLYFIFKTITSSGWWSVLTWPLLVVIPTYAIPKLLLFDKVVIIEDRAYVDALQRSWDLVSGNAEGAWPRGYWIRLVLLLHVFILINLAVMVLVTPVQLIVTALLPQSLAIIGTGLGQLLSTIGSLISELYGSVCLVVFYYDIRTRKEGFDLKMLAGITQQSDRR